MPIMMFGMGGFNPSFDDEKIKTVTDSDAREAFLEYLKENSGIIENIEKDEFTQKFYDANLKSSVLIPENWDNDKHTRPTKDKADEIKENLIKNGIKLPPTSRVGSGTDMQIWTYENKVWSDHDRGLRVDVIIEFGHIIGITVDANLEEEFFF